MNTTSIRCIISTMAKGLVIALATITIITAVAVLMMPVAYFLHFIFNIDGCGLFVATIFTFVIFYIIGAIYKRRHKNE